MSFGKAAGRDQVRPFVWLVAAKNGKVRWLGVPSPPSERITDQRLPVFRTTTVHSFGPSLCAAASCSDSFLFKQEQFEPANKSQLYVLVDSRAVVSSDGGGVLPQKRVSRGERHDTIVAVASGCRVRLERDNR